MEGKPVYHSRSRWQPSLASVGRRLATRRELLRDNFRVPDQCESQTVKPAGRIYDTGPDYSRKRHRKLLAGSVPGVERMPPSVLQGSLPVLHDDERRGVKHFRRGHKEKTLPIGGRHITVAARRFVNHRHGKQGFWDSRLQGRTAGE